MKKDCWFKEKLQCRYYKKNKYEEKTCRLKISQQANFTEEKDGENRLFYASQTFDKDKNDTLYLDSGFSNHMMKDEVSFAILIKLQQSQD